ncbi:MAG TPA: EamA family transporter RarD, partial [Polyangiales bacterium]|nr:EamA family transporter RarD [Polyangiales bacterium]
MSSGDSKAVDVQRGVAALLGCAAIWGALPIYLHALQGLSATLIIAYRLVLCCVFVVAWLRVRGELATVRAALADRSTRLRLAASALLISSNWLVYVWAVSQGRVVEASLGYFITPLLNVVLGVLVLHERLRRMQWAAVAFAALGVLYLTLRAGAPPFIALSLALSFSAYGLLRKTVPVEALSGLAAETLLITPLGAAYVVW